MTMATCDTYAYMTCIVKLKLTLTFDQFYRKLKENKHNNNNKDEIMGRMNTTYFIHNPFSFISQSQKE